jgi:hypothetical protein
MEDIKTLRERKETLEMETLLEKELRDAALENERIATAQIREYLNLKAELKYGIPIDDLPKPVQLLNEIRKHG